MNLSYSSWKYAFKCCHRTHQDFTSKIFCLTEYAHREFIFFKTVVGRMGRGKKEKPPSIFFKVWISSVTAVLDALSGMKCVWDI